MAKQTIKLGEGGTSPPPDYDWRLQPDPTSPARMTVQLCTACGAYAWMPLEVAGKVAQLHDKACLAPKIAALGDNLNELRMQLAAWRISRFVPQEIERGDEGDDESDEDAVTR